MYSSTGGSVEVETGGARRTAVKIMIVDGALKAMLLRTIWRKSMDWNGVYKLSASAYYGEFRRSYAALVETPNVTALVTVRKDAVVEGVDGVEAGLAAMILRTAIELASDEICRINVCGKVADALRPALSLPL